MEGLKTKTPLIPTDSAFCRRDYVQYPNMFWYDEIQFHSNKYNTDST